jgi:hypothetical protein
MVAGGRDKAFTAAARTWMLRQQCWVTPVRWMTERLLIGVGGDGGGGQLQRRWWCRIVGETLHWSTRAHTAGNLSSNDKANCGFEYQEQSVMTATRSQAVSSSKRQSTAASAAAAKAPTRRRAASNSAAVVPAVNTTTQVKTTSKATVATPKGENPKSLIQAHAAGTKKKFYRAHGATHKRSPSKASGQKVSSSISKQRGAAAASTKADAKTKCAVGKNSGKHRPSKSAQ